MNNKIVLFSVVFPGNQSYLEDFFNSLVNQTYNDFDLLLYNDGLNDINFYIDKYSDKLSISVIQHGTKLAPPKIREFAFKYLLDSDYDIIVFGDSDDYFSTNRLQEILNYSSCYDIVINDLDIVDENSNLIYKKYLSKRLKNEEVITIEHIKHYNFIGLSNSSIKRIKLLDYIIDENLIAVDWYLFSRLLLDGCNAVFTNRTTTSYRQHSSNTVGLIDIDSKKILQGLFVKEKHYELMSMLDEEYDHYYHIFNSLKNKVLNDEDLLKLY